MIENMIDQPVKSDNMITLITFEKLQQVQEMITPYLLDYNYFNQHHKMIATDLSKQQALDADPKAMQEIYFTGNLEHDNDAIMFYITEEGKENALDFSQRAVKVLWIYFHLT